MGQTRTSRREIAQRGFGRKPGGEKVILKKAAEGLNSVEPFSRSRNRRTFFVSEVGLNRVVVRQLVEEQFRAVILQGRYNGEHNVPRDTAIAMSLDLTRRHQEQIDAIAALMPPEQATLFRQMIMEEVELFADAHQRDPDASYRRLGLQPTSTPQVEQTTTYQRQGIGEMAVRTAVRATIWELIFSLFRR